MTAPDIPSLTDAAPIHRWKGHDGDTLELVRLASGALAMIRIDRNGTVKGATTAQAGDTVALAQRILLDDTDAMTIANIKTLAMAVIAAACEGAAHPDDIAVDRFAAVMKAKLAEARQLGRGGWDDPAVCSRETLAKMLMNHTYRGDPVDVANFCMMLHARGDAGNGGVLANVAERQLNAMMMAGGEEREG